jgi:hypothetical protein
MGSSSHSVSKFKGTISWTFMATITIGFFVGLATLLGRLWLGRRGVAAVAYWLVANSRPNGCPKLTWGRTLKKAPKWKCKGLLVDFKEWRAKQRIGRSGDRGRTRNLCLLPRIDPIGLMRIKMNIALRIRALSPVRLVLEDSSIRFFFCYLSMFLWNWGV